METFRVLHERYETLLLANELATPPAPVAGRDDFDKDLYERMAEDDSVDVATLWKDIAKRIDEVRGLMNASWAEAINGRIPLLSQPTTKLYVAPSQIPGAGSGLFAKEDLEVGSVACRYVGDIHTVSSFRAVDDNSYGIFLPLHANSNPDDEDSDRCWRESLPRPRRDIIVDPSSLERYSDVPARYINDPRSESAFNCTFVPDAVGLCAKVLVTREIRRGDELFVDYGELYWSSKDYEPTRLAR